MPTYEYECDKCKKNFDLYQSMKDDALTTCPEEKCCETPWGQGKVKRLLGTGAGLIFKGSGFYTTDYRSEGYKASAKKDSSSATTTSSGDSGKKEAPTAAKPAESKSTPAKTE